jgi:hypothetical protein
VVAVVHLAIAVDVPEQQIPISCHQLASPRIAERLS